MDKLHVTPENLADMDDYFHFGRRLVAERLSMNRSTVNVTNTKHQEQHEQYSHPAYRGAVDVCNDAHFATIPPGVDPALFGAQACSNNEKETHQLIQEKLKRDLNPQRRDLPGIIAASRLDPKKNHIGLVKAFAESPTLQEKANLVLFTRGLDNPLQNKAEDENLEMNILSPIRDLVEKKEITGKVSAFSLPNQQALAAAYRFFAQRGSVFALVSHHEPFGLAPLEAAVAGLPVVVTQNGGLTESLRYKDQQYGILVDPSNPDDIAEGLENVLSNAELWQDLHQRSREYILKHYTWESTALDYLNQLEDIVSNPNKPRRQVDVLPIHPYFREPRPETDVSLEELSHLYFENES
jgi:sucrose-phosphate synthase